MGHREPPELSARFLQSVLEKTSDMVFVVDVRGGIRRCFGAAHGFYEDDELVGRRVFEIVHPDDRARASQHFERMMSGETVDTFELRGLRSDGTHRWFEITAAMWVEEDGEKLAVILNRDIHDHKLAEATLVASEQRYRALVDQSPLGILVVDQDLNLVSANDAYVQQVGAPNREALVGHNVLHSPAVDEATMKAAREQLERGITISTELSYVSLFGKQVDVRATISPVRSDDGEPVGAQVVFEDVSESRRLEEQLRHSQKMEAVGRLAGGVAHDFNNNLTVILGLAEYLADDPMLGEEARKTAAEIAREAERSAVLTAQLLAFSRPTPPKLEPVDVGRLVGRMQQMLARAMGEFIDLDTKRFATPPIAANSMLLEQAIVNLAMNARDAMPDGGHLEIRVGSKGDRVVIEVADDGIGMDADTARQSFEPFFTTKEAAQGTGLGLSIVYGIVKQSGGEISVDSEPGVGTRFELSFPALVDGRAALDLSDTSEAAQTEPSGRILVLEDQGPVRRLLRNVLGRAGYDVLVAATGDEAIDLARKADPPFDLLLSDVRLPGRSGPETAATLREEFPALGVLYISGYNDAAIDSEGRMVEDGSPLLPKPFTSRRLLESVRSVLSENG